MSDYEDIMDLLGGPAVAPSGGEWWGHGVDLGPISAPTVTDTTSNADLWLPTSVALHYREYDRSGRAVDELEEQIRQQGLLTPIRISTDGEVAVVHEGNHRLQVADRLGIREVPVIVTLDSRVVSNGGRVTPLEPVLGSWVEQNRGRLRSFWGHRTAQDYFMQHRPAGPDYGGQMHDVSDFFPDIETLPTRMYDFGEPGSQGSIRQIIDAQGNPNKSVTIYRAVPKGTDPIIRDGDWVSISREYAEQHGMSNVGGVYDILSATVQAKDIWTDGNSVNEWGYWGPELRTARTYTASAGKLYRGVRIDLGIDLNLAQPGTSIETVGQELQLGPQVLDALSRQGGLGTHWSTRPEIAERFALESSGNGGGTPVLVTVDWDGSGEDLERTDTGGTWTDEAEVTLLPGTPITVTSIKLGSSFRDGVEVLHSDRYLGYASDFAAAGLPVPQGGPQQRTAASSPGTLYRGLAVPFSEAQIEDVMEAYGKDSFVGRVLGYLSRGFFTPNREWGLGKHWTTNINVAKSFSQNGFGTPVVLVAEWDGSGEDPYNAPGNNFGGEDEVTLLPETELRLVDVLWGPTFESIGGSGRTITAGGSLPPGLRLENPKPNQVVAYDDDNPDPWLSRFGVAVLSWDDDGVISWVAIQDDSYKRRGIATAMLEYARTIRPDIRHSDELSESGAGWAQAVGSRTAGTRTDPGGVYRGINVQVLSHDEQEEVAAWANSNSFSMDDYQLAEPNYELVYRILDRLDSGGLGRHWSKDYDVSADFARDQGDGIELILIGHWEGEGFDTREFHRGWDGVQRPSNLPHEEEVTLYPGTPVTLVGMDIVTETGFTYNIPVPNIQVTAGHDMKHLANRTAANDLRVHLFDSERHEMFLEPDFDSSPWTYHRKVMDAVRYLADVAQTNGVYWHMDHNEWIPSKITDFKVFDGPNDVTHEIKEFPQLRGYYASRKLAQERFPVELSGGYTGEAFYTGGENMLGTGPWAMEVFTPSGAPVATVYHEYDDLKKWAEKVVEHDQAVTAYRRACRTAAEPGGVLPWVPSQNGYYWITKNDDSLEAVTNDGVNRMRLYEKPWGWEWVVRDAQGVVERGSFGSAMAPDALRDRADDLLAEFDTNPLRRTRGPGLGYQDDYTQAPNHLWSNRMALYHETGNSSGVAVVLTFPMEYREALALPEGSPAEELHITLGYFGDITELDPEEDEKLRQACILTASQINPFVVTLGGLIRFSGEGQDAFVLNADSPEIDNARGAFLENLQMTGAKMPDSTHGFTPHCTLGYLNPDDSLPFDRWDPVEVPVTAVELWWGETPDVFPLGVTPAVAQKKTTSQRYAERLNREGRR